MDDDSIRALQQRLEQVIFARLSLEDPAATVTSCLRDGCKIDMTIISRRFEGMDDLERSAYFWPMLEEVPRSELVYMTYCLQLTPDEAMELFAEST